MKKGLLSSYVSGITDVDHGESYGKIFRYFFPEFVTALVLYSLLYLLEAKWIADLKSTSTYATLGVINTLLHFIMKVAEGISVGVVVLSGQYNGMQDYKEAGNSFIDAFWTTVFMGASIAGLLYFGAHWIYQLYGVPADMVAMGVPFLRLRAIGVFFTFVYFAFIGFMRGLKDTKTPMKIFMAGAVVFIFFDYVLIFGHWGFPRMGLQGSALAGCIQFGLMMVLAAGYIIYHRSTIYKNYNLNLFAVFRSNTRIKQLLDLSWPVVIDKAVLAWCYIWLGAMLARMGGHMLPVFAVVKDLERLSFLPAVAFAQVITFLVSNDFGSHNWDGIKSNIKKTVFLASGMVFAILFVFSSYPVFFIQFFDKQGDFTNIASAIFPILSVLVFFDLLQLILSGAMRGAANVKTVMMTRLVICFFYFMPMSYLLANLDIQNSILKFILVYGSFYIGNGLMSVVYINRFRGEEWKLPSIAEVP